MIHISDYDREWPQQFESEAVCIRGTLGALVLELQHVGSTSVPGLAAKPVIDIALCVANSADEAAYAPALITAGYALTIREPEWFEHRMFKRAAPEANLHVFSLGCPEVARMMNFRDWLRRNAADRALYDETKRALATRGWGDVQEYADAKSAVVTEIMARAEERHRFSDVE